MPFLNTMDITEEVLNIYDTSFVINPQQEGFVGANPDDYRITSDQNFTMSGSVFEGQIDRNDLQLVAGKRKTSYLVEIIYNDIDGYFAGDVNGNGQQIMTVIDSEDFNFNPPNIPNNIFSYNLQLNGIFEIDPKQTIIDAGIVDPDGGEINVAVINGFQFDRKDPREEWEDSAYPFNPFQAGIVNNNNSISGLPSKRGTYYFLLRVTTTKNQITSWSKYFKGVIVVQ